LPTLLSINNYYYRRGGAEVIFIEQNRLFAKFGWNVVPFSMQHPRNLDTPWSKYFVSEIEFGEPYSVWGKIARVPKAIYSFEARRKLDRLIDSVRPDVSHSHNIYHHISPAVLGVLKRRGVPTVLTLHDLKLVCPAYSMLTHDGICERCKNGKLYNVVIHRCMKGSLALSGIVMVESCLHRVLGSYEHNVDRFVVPSRFYKEKMAEWGWDSGRFVHIPNFVDVGAHQPDFRVGKAFLYFGRLSPEKGLSTLVRAATMAKVPVWIAGTGPQERSLRKLAERAGADVTFLGYLTGEALHNAVRSARATVLPSECYENGPLGIMESYALGTPVIGAAIGGIPELIYDGETGLTFQSGSVEGLAVALRRVADMPDQQLAEMGRNGRAWMESDYTAERYRGRLLELYADMGVSF
jgi:glycosyltransferase involved in cell wall biosynthesis